MEAKRMRCDDSWRRSHAEIIKQTYTWTITNFSHRQERMYSEFGVWRLVLLPSLNDGELTTVSLMLRNERDLRALYTIEVRTSDDHVIGRPAGTVKDETTLFQRGSVRSIRLNRSEVLSKVKSAGRDDTLIVRCEVCVVGEDTVTYGRTDGECVCAGGVQTLGTDLSAAVNNSMFSDVVIVADGREFRVHKVILAARSPVFRAMFEHHLQETQLNRVEVSDVSSDVFESLLSYIYTDQVPDMKRAAVGLLAAADKYQLDGLKRLCSASVSDDIIVDNVCDVLELAYLHNDDRLKQQAIGFINRHAAQVHENPKFKQLARCHPELLVEVYVAAVCPSSTRSRQGNITVPVGNPNECSVS